MSDYNVDLWRGVRSCKEVRGYEEAAENEGAVMAVRVRCEGAVRQELS